MYDDGHAAGTEMIPHPPHHHLEEGGGGGGLPAATPGTLLDGRQSAVRKTVGVHDNPPFCYAEGLIIHQCD